MSAKRKVFVQTDLSIPIVQHDLVDGVVTVPSHVLPPTQTSIEFPPEHTHGRTFDFAPWYGVGIDEITYACQRQIERFLAKQDLEVTSLSVASYCRQGLRTFLDYLAMLCVAKGRPLTLHEINRDVMDGYIASFDDENISVVSKKTRYHATKSVLKALCERGVIIEIRGGDNATFPTNLFPGAARAKKGARPLAAAQRKAFSLAVKDAVMPIFDSDVEPTSHLLAYALLVIALHTGRNTTPLLEMTADCLRSHPKANTCFLVLYKRRGHSTSKVAIRDSRTHELEIEAMPTLRPTIARLVRRVIELSEQLKDEAPDHFKNRIWFYRARSGGRGTREIGEVCVLTDRTLLKAIRTLVRRYDLKDTDGKPLRINVSRLRKTFVNRMYEILDGDIVATAAAAGNTVRVASINYLRPGEDAQKNWKFLGMALTVELLTATLGATERTPVGRCSDVKNGDYAPKRGQLICTSFLNCIRCRNYVVTADDLYRLFSFYWRILAERSRTNPKRWRKQLAHIVRLIDRDVIEAGIRRGVFKRAMVDRERERARQDPHPFWSSESIIGDIENLTA
ncbi:phage integrase [Burkholderia pseudomallei]|nr:phage integrase [Burkholderia pseudomallei]CAJ4234655.1 phage integrase [Burkholderia pseudomallei]CAK0569190.1 phage integrase [Burkholderia pseudomallei]